MATNYRNTFRLLVQYRLLNKYKTHSHYNRYYKNFKKKKKKKKKKNQFKSKAHFSKCLDNFPFFLAMQYSVLLELKQNY